MSTNSEQDIYRVRLQEALVALQEMRSKLETLGHSSAEPIAVIGLGCRFPGGSDNPRAYWRLLQAGVDAIGEVPAERWDVETLYDPNPEVPGKMSTRWGGFLTGVDQFDAEFFGISPREARSLDPQQRLLLEVGWEALEHAGQAPTELGDSLTGVFIGITLNDYLQLQTKVQSLTDIDAYRITGNSLNSAAGRLSYTLGLQGPAMVVDTACSSSLVAIHLACQSLRAGESELVLAGGVNLILTPDMSIGASEAKMMAADGRCKTFDARADGFVRSEGCGIVVLKRLSAALAAGDNILALIRGTAVNQDGFSSGLTVPNKRAQEAVIRTALANARVKPAQVSYVEAHGTGTSLGDPIEVRALAAVLGQERDANSPFYLGSVKTNIGHLESAAGVAGLIKVILALQHREIPPHLHFQTPSPNIDWDRVPAVVPVHSIPWTGEERIAGISSFGASGTNAHAIVSAAPGLAAEREAMTVSPHLLVLSAKNDGALKDLAARYEDYLARHSQSSLADVCFTANTGRAHFEQRLAVVGDSPQQMCRRLTDFLAGQVPVGVVSGRVASAARPKIAFLFTGHGSQYTNMGRELYTTEPVFRQTLDQCADLLQPYLEEPLPAIMFPESEESPFWEGMRYTQPMLFALEYALVMVWRSWGVEPDVVLGHSVGEYVAACVAGVLSLEDSLKLVATRGRLMDELPQRGVMAAVFSEESRVATAIAPYPDVSIAVINGSTNIVISGTSKTVKTIMADLRTDGIKSRRLAVDQASHSPLIEPILADFERTARTVSYTVPRIPLVSNLTGQLFKPGEGPDSVYWRRHLRHTVRFAAGIELLHRQGCELFLEIGPSPTLLGMGRRCLSEDVGIWLPSLRKRRRERQQMLESLGHLYVQGVKVNWRGFNQEKGHRRLALPTYPFQRKRYWINTEPRPAPTSGSMASLHPLLGYRLRSSGREIIFESRLSLDTHPFLADHRVHGSAILPATAYIEMAQAAGRMALGISVPSLEGVVIHHPLPLPDGRTRTVQLVLTAEADGKASFQISSLDERDPGQAAERWTKLASGMVRVAQPTETEMPDRWLKEIRDLCQETVSVSRHYERLSAHGLEFGSGFRGVERIWQNEQQDDVIGQINLPPALAPEANAYGIHPALLDACLQVLGNALPDDGRGDETYLPLSLDRFRLYNPPTERLWSHVSLRSENGSRPEALMADVRLFDNNERLVAEISGFILKRISWKALASGGRDRFDDWLHEVVWRPEPPQPTRNAAINLLSPHLVAEHLQPYLARLGKEEKTVSFHHLKPQLEALSAAYITTALHQLGWNFELDQQVSRASLAAKLGVDKQYDRLLTRLLEVLQEEGVLEKVADDEWKVVQIPDPVDQESRLSQLLDVYPACRIELTMTGRIGRQFASALRGECDPLDLLYPEGSLQETEQLYQDSPLAYGFNRLVQEAIAIALEPVPRDRPLRILEIGAGTGGTTAHVLPRLDPERTEYFFTDISPLFIGYAKQKFQNYSFVRYQILDIEQDPEAQGFAVHQFDLVLAANVVHATAELRQTLRYIRQLLASDGLLVLLEATEPQRFADIIVGLTDGWWKFNDVELRRSYPLISGDQWLKLLLELGYLDVTAVSNETTLSHQTVLLAQGPHLRQKQNGSADLERTGNWLVFADEGGTGQQLAARLQARGHNPTLVYAGGSSATGQKSPLRVNPGRPEDFQQVIGAEISSGDPAAWQGIIYLWPLDHPLSYPTELAPTDLAQIQEKVCGSLLYLVQALARQGESTSSGLWLITRGAQAVGTPDEIALPGLAQSTVWGLGKVIAQEHPEMHCTRVDLDPSGTPDEVEALLQIIETRGREDQVALRRNKRFVPRLVLREFVHSLLGDQLPSLNGQPFKLSISSRGILDNLEFRPLSRRSPGPGEVEIDVAVAGLGFRDVLNALGMVAQDTGPLGGECSGAIVAVGPDIDHFKVGDEVMAMALGSFRSHITIPAAFVVQKPECLSLIEGATIPSAFLTAYYTLNHCVSMQAGDRVLIHAATGGVGLAAVQLAQRAGAELFGTAGTPAKRALLKSLGVQHVMDSRSLSFAEEIMSITKGQGVDIILNSLSGDFILTSLSVLAEEGTFLEIGKRDIWDRAQVAQLKPKATYIVADLVTLAEEDPVLITTMLRELMAAFNEGTLNPLPLQVFSIESAVDAFRYMAQARHIGKIVVTLNRPRSDRNAFTIHANASYLITGGLGGLGLVVARWFIEQGAHHLVLVGRNAPSDRVCKMLSELEQTGARIGVIQADVSSAEAFKQVMTQIGEAWPPLRGIIHAAGVLDDGVLLQQEWSRFIEVFQPKVAGGWNLHQLTRHMDLDFFVLFSSAVSLLGSAGQPNHVAASTFLDALAHYRCSQGLPALSIDWGPWAEVGAAAQDDIEARVSMRGVDTLHPWQGLEVFEQIMDQASNHAGDTTLTQIGVLPVSWSKFLQRLAAMTDTGQVAPFFSEVAQNRFAPQGQSETKTKAVDAAPALLERLMKVPAGKRQTLLQEYVQAKSLKVLGLESTYELDPRKPLQELGLDSLMAVELRSLLGTGLNLQQTLPATLVFSHPTVEALANYIGEQLFSSESDQSASRQESEPTEQVDLENIALANLEQLSEEEAETILQEQLKKGYWENR